jgi:broad specificity phosphatase PhoE
MTTPTTLILCRHGQSEGNREARFGGHGPTPLTALGRAQARATAEQLAGGGPAILYSSDLVRARETAEIIGSAIVATPQITPALRERSVGKFTGLTFDEARANFPDDYAALLRRAPDACPPGGETYLQCRERASAFLDRVLALHMGQRIVLVSHHLTLYQLSLHILNLSSDVDVSRVYIRIDNCGLHRFERYDDGVWQVIALNDTAHLAALSREAP